MNYKSCVNMSRILSVPITVPIPIPVPSYNPNSSCNCNSNSEAELQQLFLLLYHISCLCLGVEVSPADNKFSWSTKSDSSWWPDPRPPDSPPHHWDFKKAKETSTDVCQYGPTFTDSHSSRWIPASYHYVTAAAAAGRAGSNHPT